MLFVFLVLGAVLVSLYIIYRRRASYFTDRGLTGPPPTIVFGNLFDVFRNTPPLKLQEWTSKYGETYGYFEGSTPVLVTTNLDILNDVFVKKFANFHGRKLFSLQGDPDTNPKADVFSSRGLRWKRLRSIANPTFTSGKLKQLYPGMVESSDLMISRLIEATAYNSELDIFPFFQKLTLEIIAKIAFGETASLQGSGDDNPYLESCREIFQPKQKYTRAALAVGATLFPELKEMIRMMQRKFMNHPGYVLERIVKEKIKERKKGQADVHHDFIQLFLEAEAEEGTEEKDLNINTDSRQQLTMNKLQVTKKLSPVEIVSQLNLFLLAGYDTTSNALAYMVYRLAMNPISQQKLFKEVQQVMENNGNDEISFDNVLSMRYLDLVMKETLRMHPLASIVQSRICMEDCEVGAQQLRIEKGLSVWADVWTIHYDKSVWGQDADQFRPERFSEQETKSRHPMAFLSFGAGPRMCIGMRLAQLEAKMTLAKLVATFKIVKCQKTDPLEVTGFSTISPKNVFVQLEARGEHF